MEIGVKGQLGTQEALAYKVNSRLPSHTYLPKVKRVHRNNGGTIALPPPRPSPIGKYLHSHRP